MEIISITGNKLLEEEIIAQIKKQSDLLLSEKNVASAWQAANHLKKELSSLSPELVRPVLSEYRTITTNLKSLSLPLLEKEEIKNLLQNNLDFLDKQYEDYVVTGIRSWILAQESAKQETLKKEIISYLPQNSSLLQKVEQNLNNLNPEHSFDSNSNSKKPENTALAQKQSSDEMFDETENKEIAEHGQKVQNLEPKNLSLGNPVDLTEKIYSISKTKNNKETFVKRAQSLITSRLRDIRTPAELRDYFSRNFQVGGLSLSGEVLEQALSLVDNNYKNIHKNQPNLLRTEEKISQRQNLSKEESSENNAPPQKREKVTKSETNKEPVDMFTSSASAPATPPGSQENKKQSLNELDKLIQQDAANTPLNLPAKDKKQPTQSQPKKEKQASFINRTTNDSARPSMTDVKNMSEKLSGKTISRSDEFKLMTIEDFRKFGNPEEAVGKILEKLDLLKKESLAYKTEAIKFFRQSDLFQNYLSIGNVSLGGNKKLNEVLKDKAVNLGNINEDEFFAIASLNSKLN